MDGAHNGGDCLAVRALFATRHVAQASCEFSFQAK
jgi:hypothetical protein